jgi:hypothetical protein
MQRPRVFIVTAVAVAGSFSVFGSDEAGTDEVVFQGPAGARDQPT